MGNRLLLADDSITIQKVVAIIFANEEFELTVVDNGNAALDKAREILPDLMLVDAQMPGKSGYEVCAEIRRDPRLSFVPILLLIGAFENPEEGEASSCGADAFISKPFESQQLIDQVKELLALGKSRCAAPLARPLPIESGAEELWGDLSAFDTEPPPEAPAAAGQEAFGVTPAPFEEDIVEASVEDDLWGAFEVEEAGSVAVAAATTAPAFTGLEPAEEFEVEEYFSFDEDSEEIEETGPALDFAETVEAAVEEPVLLASDEDLFSCSDDLTFASPAGMEPLTLPEYEPEPLPVLEPQSAPVSRAQVGDAGGAGGAGVQPAALALSDAELVAALTRISKEVIERIVWEVVPDLAESLIKEEIRKLKAGVRR